MFPAGVIGIGVRTVTLPSGLRLRLAESGERGQRPVLLLHGWGASLYMWRDWFAPLSAAGRWVIAVDLPGHGLSDKPTAPRSYTLDALLADLRALLDVEAFDDVDIVAQSMAGTIALELALRGESRVRRLVLVNPALFGRIRLQKLGRLVSPSIVDHVLPRLVARSIVARTHRLVYGDASKITERDEDEYWAPSQFPSYARAMRRLIHEFRWERSPAAEMAARMETLLVPVLVVLGTQDRLVKDARAYVDDLVKAGARVEVAVVKGGGHAVNEECAAETSGLALAFFERSR